MNNKLSKLTNRQYLQREMQDYIMIAFGMILYCIGWTVFLLPNDITTGGVPGIASVVYFAIKLPVQYVYFGLNERPAFYGLRLRCFILWCWNWSCVII